MILSMTGFGKAVVSLPGKKITVEIKSLNSKQMDLAARVPSLYREKELELRSIVAKALVRGKGFTEGESIRRRIRSSCTSRPVSTVWASAAPWNIFPSRI